jgi:4-methylaminobutanoate oxidase (formaldehyde-forming)
MECIHKMESCDVVVIGGGVLGAAVAFNLAKRGAGKVVVLERDSVAEGNSSLAAGLLTRGRLKSHLIPLVLETYQAIDEIESLSGESLGMHQPGCLYVAVSHHHQKGVTELASVSKAAGLRVERLDNLDAAHLIPWLKLSRDCMAIYMPDDGYIDGYALTRGFLACAKKSGAQIREQTEVLSILREDHHVSGVRTEKGDMSAGMVIDAAGVWAGKLALELGISLPMAPIRSHYWITSTHRAFSPDHPFVILPDARAYARPESSRLLFGFREANSVAVHPSHLPDQMSGYVFKQDPSGWESLLEGIPDLGKVLPLVEEIEISSYIKGLSNYTPDGNFVLGAFPGMNGFLAATGCSGAGIAMSGGIGRLIAELCLEQRPFIDPEPHRIDRFGRVDPLAPSFLKRCAEARSGKITG